ncbi:leucine--tRNA ligase, partial [Candidatus Saccharibacteria bacterium]|nr:leucine--tRNA ligase [Candidatus Saccharibacteria bacterium]
EHELLEQIVTDDQKTAVDEYIKQSTKRSEVERQANKDKTGVFTGAYAVNPANDEKIPIWVADYVLVGYGTGAIMAVPAHDERDNEFANKFDLPITEVVETGGEARDHEGIMINSGQYDGMRSSDAREQIVADLAQNDLATEKTTFKIRDWSVSRQRYWGAPIPVINCPQDGIVLVPEDQLPVTLPELADFQPSGDGRSALARAEDWINVACPQCGNPAKRETDTLDTYICSSWYFLRYLDPVNSSQIFDTAIINKWMPIDFYNGGDHATAHMIYARFVTRFMHKLGLIDNPEPFKRFLFNGKVTASDGQMFSKSKGNGVDPLEIINQGYGADALRTYLMFAAPLDLWIRWDPQGVPGAYRFLNRIWNITQDYLSAEPATGNSDAPLRVIHRAIKKVTEDLEDQKFNTAIATMMKATNELYDIKAKDGVTGSSAWREAVESLIMLVAPFAPHTAEELWHELGHDSSVHVDNWPVWNDNYLVADTINLVVQINGKLRATIEAPAGIDRDNAISTAQIHPKIADLLADKTVQKAIYVPNKLVNFVV